MKKLICALVFASSFVAYAQNMVLIGVDGIKKLTLFLEPARLIKLDNGTPVTVAVGEVSDYSGTALVVRTKEMWNIHTPECKKGKGTIYFFEIDKNDNEIFKSKAAFSLETTDNTFESSIAKAMCSSVKTKSK